MAVENDEQVRSYSREVARRVAALRGCAVRRIGRIQHPGSEVYPVFRITRGSGPRHVLLAAGIHGSEPAGVFALLDFLEHHAARYTRDCTFHAFPCINPWGFERHERRPPHRKDLNCHFHAGTLVPECGIVLRNLRKKGYSLAIDLHESNPASREQGSNPRTNPRAFFLFEACDNPLRLLHPAVIRAVRRVAQVWDGKTVWGAHSEGGAVLYPSAKNRRYSEWTTLEGYVYKSKGGHACTFETPRHWPLEKRIRTHVAALRGALDAFVRRPLAL